MTLLLCLSMLLAPSPMGDKDSWLLEYCIETVRQSPSRYDSEIEEFIKLAKIRYTDDMTHKRREELRFIVKLQKVMEEHNEPTTLLVVRYPLRFFLYSDKFQVISPFHKIDYGTLLKAEEMPGTEFEWIIKDMRRSPCGEFI